MSKAIFLGKAEGKPGKVYYPLALKTLPQPTPKGTELLVKLSAAALNHRDVFLRQHLYPGLTFDVPMGADGVGTVVGAGPDVKFPERWQGKRVIFNPGIGWKDSLEGPEDPTGYKIMGGTKFYDKGTLQDYITIDESEVEEAPEHLSDAEAAALPLAGLTGWRALVVKAGERNTGKGAAVLITGIGGGVALISLLFAVARGADVYVTSSSEEKIRKSIELGAKGGVNYKEDGWEKKLLGLLPKGKKNFDAVIDGAGGNSVEKSVKLLKAGGVLSIYGMTVSPVMPFLMQAVLKNIDVRGSTMGSRKEFKDMVEFVKTHKVRPVVSRVVQAELSDVAALDGLFQDMKDSKQFGKLVIEFGKSSGTRSFLNCRSYCSCRLEVTVMDEDLIQKYGPGMSFYHAQIKAAQRQKRLGGEAVLTRYCAALRELTLSNKLLEGKVKQLCSDSLRLTFDVTLLKRHMKAISGELLVTWQADVLTRLVEVIYERHGWRMPGEVLVSDKYSLDRDTLSKIYVMAARKIKKETIMKKAVGLSEQYYLALQRYSEVASPLLPASRPFYRPTA
ncbi:zinc-dependent alcohol dehydrogenase family protein [Aspergillus foveolatus]|uniref:zinc-dependent alcohol dehydrogenase family protein n=1 Tax=Aspergillus foveolatus TaxID=210207 RepID=UPI003CCDBE4E